MVVVKSDLDLDYPSNLQLLSTQDLIKTDPRHNQPVYESPSGKREQAKCHLSFFEKQNVF